MRKLAFVMLVGLLFKGSVGALAVNAAGQSPARYAANRPLGRQAPASLPYVMNLPLVMQRSVPGYTSPFGIDMYGGNSDVDGAPQMLAAGSAWETVIFDWSQIEPTAPISGVHTYNWTGFDGTVARAQADGMSLFVLFTNNPAWAADLAGGPVHPANVADLNSVAAAAAERYDGDGLNDAPGSPVIRYWSFYAEPDNGDLWRAQTSGKGYWGNNPSGYADMLDGVSAAIHSVDPDAVVMIGGIAYDFFAPSGPFVQGFLAGVLDRLNSAYGGVTPTLGAMAFHYYPISTTVWPTIREKALEIRSILSAHGAGNLPLIVPEMGYWSDLVPKVPALNSDETKQARGLTQMFVRGFSVGIRQMSWFMVFDSGPATEAHGLFRGTDLSSPKPAYAAYATLTTELSGAQYSSALSGPGLEGYLFSLPGGLSKTVVWASGQASSLVTFHASCVRRVDYLGNVTTPIKDGDVNWDKDNVAGQITLQVFQDQPIYVGSC